jgi:hypothetical protein
MTTLDDIRKALTEVREFTGDQALSIEVESGKARLVRVVPVPDDKVFVLEVCCWRTTDEFVDYMAMLVAGARRHQPKA